jgi:hypothetical protein
MCYIAHCNFTLPRFSRQRRRRNDPALLHSLHKLGHHMIGPEDTHKTNAPVSVSDPFLQKLQLLCQIRGFALNIAEGQFL